MITFWVDQRTGGVRECEMGDTLFNTVPGSRTKPAVVKPQCCCCSSAAIGLIFTGLVPDMGCLFTAAIKHVRLHFFPSSFVTV